MELTAVMIGVLLEVQALSLERLYLYKCSFINQPQRFNFPFANSNDMPQWSAVCIKIHFQIRFHLSVKFILQTMNLESSHSAHEIHARLRE